MASTSLKSIEPASLGELITHIEQEHHTFTRNELEKISCLLQAIKAGRQEIPAGLERCLHDMEADLVPHLMKEEHVLFPYIIELEKHPDAPPHACFGSVANPIRMMQHEHAALIALLERLRALTCRYTTDPQSPFAELFAILARLDDDLMQHIHWEDDVLFPRALELERPATDMHA